MWGSRLLIWLSLAILLHSAYAAWLARTAAKASGIEGARVWGTAVPPEVLIESLSAFFFLVVGILWSAPTLKGVTWASEMSKRSIDSEDSGVGLGSVRHRGSALFGEKEDE
ncbi:hypothetical protein JCM11641_005486 [Rhodosporidiobolus odoratus]